MTLTQDLPQFVARHQATPEWSKVRKHAVRYVENKGFPSRKDEDWKYTSVKTLSDADFKFTKVAKLSKEQKIVLEQYLNKKFINLVFINGELSAEFSQISQLEKIANWSSLSDVMTGKKFKNLISIFRGQRKIVGSVRQDVFEALSSAYSWNGSVIEIKKNNSVTKPIHLIHLNVGSKQASYSKNYLILNEFSKLSLIETYVGDASFVCQSSEILIKESAALEYVRVQESAVNTNQVGVTRFYLHKFAQLESTAYATGGLLSRHNLECYVCGPEALAKINGLTLASQKQHFDSHTLIDHVEGGSQTTQLYKSILNDEARSVFDGKVVIRHLAQKANSDQLAKSLLLSSKAESDSKPCLEIYADDVKATHGSTVGQLNEDEIFYMLSRAISRKQAVEMLSLGFVTDVVYQISNIDIQDWLLGLLKSAYRKLITA